MAYTNETIYGVSCGSHDAALAVIHKHSIDFAAHSERYSRIKNDPDLNHGIVDDARDYGRPDVVVYYENPWKRWSRNLYAGQPLKMNPKKYLREFFPWSKVKTVGHHESHAAGGYFTSPFSEAAVIVVDAIGEWDTITVWDACGTNMRCIYRVQYPHSLGLLYSAMTHRVGLKPNENEYILMAMAAFGRPDLVPAIKQDFIESTTIPDLRLKKNVHRGIKDWMPGADSMDIACSMQVILEEYLSDLFEWAAYTTKRKNVVFAGGVALNCLANANIRSAGHFDNWWIMPNPGDAGSSLGAALAYRKDFVEWKTPYLGTNISGSYDVVSVVEALKQHGLVGLARGRAEFGPRAFGNRSILADPRSKISKVRVNQIKGRELFRPFAPIVMKEWAHKWFDLPAPESPYMQYAVKCRMPSKVPAVIHADGTARVQTLSKEQNPKLYELLEVWYHMTGVPILLNTSFNGKGEPIVNTRAEAEETGHHFNIPVF